MSQIDQTSGLSPGALQRVIDTRVRLQRSVTSWCGDATEADDILQAAYVRALERGGSLRDEERVVPWFARLVRNVAVDRSRMRGTRTRATEKWARGEPEAADPLDNLDAAVCDCVLGVLDDLSPRYAEVIRLVELDGLEPAEAARRLGTTANNLRVRLHRSRAALRKRLLVVCGACAEHGCIECSCPPRS